MNTELTQSLSPLFAKGVMVYIAAPYSPDANSINHNKIIEDRMELFSGSVAKLITMECHAVSPLFNHYFLHHRNIPGTWDYWKSYSENLLQRSDAMLILMIDGWDRSKGVKGEIEMAKDMNKPVFITDVAITSIIPLDDYLNQ